MIKCNCNIPKAVDNPDKVVNMRAFTIFSDVGSIIFKLKLQRFGVTSKREISKPKNPNG